MTARARATTVVLAAIGAAVSAYLSWVRWSGSLALCIGVGGCETVQSSRYAVVGDVPVAAIGLAGFLLMGAVGLRRLRGGGPEWALTALFGMALGGTLYAAYLTYVELFVLRAICPWCVSIAVSVVGILALTVWELRASE